MMNRIAWLLAGAALASASSGMAEAKGKPRAQTGRTATRPADARFRALSEAEYQWRISQSAADDDSGSAGSRQLPDEGPAAQAARLARWEATAKALDAIDPASLSPSVRIDYMVYRGQIDALLAAQRFREYEKPLTADTSFWGNLASWARGASRPRRSTAITSPCCTRCRAISIRRSRICAPGWIAVSPCRASR